jgi:hypothetical protein
METDSGDHVVVLYGVRGATWEAVRVIGGGFGGPGALDGQLHMPFGLRFSRDGSVVCVADARNNRVSLFCVRDGALVRHIALGPEASFPIDVEEVEGGWLAVGWHSGSVEFVGDDGSADGGGSVSVGGGTPAHTPWTVDCPTAVAYIPGLGLVVRELWNGEA